MAVSAEGHYAGPTQWFNSSSASRIRNVSFSCLVLRNGSLLPFPASTVFGGGWAGSLYSRARQYSTLLISQMNLPVCPNLGTDMIPTSLPHGINILSRLGTPVTPPHRDNRVVTVT